MSLVDLTNAGRQFVPVWNMYRFDWRELEPPMGNWPEVDERVAAPRLKMTDRAGRWVPCEVVVVVCLLR